MERLRPMKGEVIHPQRKRGQVSIVWSYIHVYDCTCLCMSMIVDI